MVNPLEQPTDELSSSEFGKIYERKDYTTLYRYENPNEDYDPRREGTTSKEEIIGQWFTENLDDLRAYIKMKQPGGHVVVVRIPTADKAKYDAGNLDITKEMDRETGNFIVPSEIQQETKLVLPLYIEAQNARKFMMGDWKKIDNFVAEELSASNLIRIARKQDRE